MFLTLFSRRLDAISITQMRVDANAPTIKYTEIKISAMLF